MNTPENSFDDFMNTTTKGGSNAEFFDLKEKKEAKIWLHTKVVPNWFMKHDFPRRVEFTKEGQQQVAFWGRAFNCHDAVHARNYDRLAPLKFFRDRDRATWRRTHSPKDCPFCKLIEHLEGRLKSGSLKWYDDVFKFSDPLCAQAVSISAGGLINMPTRKLKQETIDEAKRYKVDLSELWKQSGAVKMQWVLALADDDDPSQLFVTVQPQVVGEKLRDAMALARKDGNLGREGGDPLRNPYPFELRYDEKEEFSKKYSVEPLMMRAGKAGPKVLELIQSAPPDLDGYFQPGDSDDLREQMERYACADIPFDQIFGGVSKTTSAVPKSFDDASPNIPEPAKSTTQIREQEKSGPVDAAPPLQRPAGRRKMVQEAPAPVEEPSVPMEPCETCGKPFPADAKECPHCGEKYV